MSNTPAPRRPSPVSRLIDPEQPPPILMPRKDALRLGLVAGQIVHVTGVACNFEARCVVLEDAQDELAEIGAQAVHNALERNQTPQAAIVHAAAAVSHSLEVADREYRVAVGGREADAKSLDMSIGAPGPAQD